MCVLLWLGHLTLDHTPESLIEVISTQTSKIMQWLHLLMFEMCISNNSRHNLGGHFGYILFLFSVPAQEKRGGVQAGGAGFGFRGRGGIRGGGVGAQAPRGCLHGRGGEAKYLFSWGPKLPSNNDKFVVLLTSWPSA